MSSFAELFQGMAEDYQRELVTRARRYRQAYPSIVPGTPAGEALERLRRASHAAAEAFSYALLGEPLDERAIERAAIVRWLRGWGDRVGGADEPSGLADEIENGCHLV